MSLLRAEWKRFFARRVTRIMMLLVLLLMTIVAAVTASDSHRPTQADRRNALAMVQQQNAAFARDLAECRAAQASGEAHLPPGQTCESLLGGKARSLSPETFMPHVWTLTTDGPDSILLLGGLLALFGFVAGASYVGAEWSSGAMMNLLLWRPRRLSVLTGKLVALSTSVTAVGVVLGAVWVGMLWLIASMRGYVGHLTPGVIQSLALDGARSLALGLAAAWLAFALASIGRHTATALGVAVAYVIVWEGGARFFLALRGNRIDRPERFFLSNYIAAWLQKVRHYVSYDCAINGEQCVPHPWRITLTSAAEVMAVVIAACLIWAYVGMARRDVT